MFKNIIHESFPHKLFVALQEAKYPSALRWAPDGKGFYVEHIDPKIPDVLQKYFQLRKFPYWYRQLHDHGWKKIVKGKREGMMVNQHFHKNMTEEDFLAIIEFKNETRKEQKAKKQGKDKALQSKKASTTVVSTKNKEKSDKTTKTRKSKGTKATKVTSKRKASPEVADSVLTRKKRKKPPKSPEPAENNQTEKKRSSIDDKGQEKRATKRLREYKKLHDLFSKWDMWNFPKGLDTFLEIGKVQSYPNKKRKTTKADAADVEPDVSYDNSKDSIATLLCDEEMPDSIMDEKDGEQALADFVDRIRKDKLRQDKLKELWSDIVVPVVKGKAIPPAKFAKPTDKWKKLKVGDRIGVYWRDDERFYNAVIQKQQEKTSYFHVLYDDDGAQEWLDLSREGFKELENVKVPVTSVHSTPRRAARHVVSTDFTSETPRKDNRARSIKEQKEEPNPTKLPDSHCHLAPFVRYSWKGLELGSRAGTPSYNSYVGERDASAPRVTALEILNDVRALRSRGFSGLSLQLETGKSSDEMSNDNHDGNGTYSDPNPMLTNQLRYLEEKISEDSATSSSINKFNRTLESVRKLTDNWSIPMVRENLRTVETQILKLNERETRILAKCKQKGLY